MQALRPSALLVALGALLWAACQQQATPERAQPADLVFVEEGTLPIVLTAPHGGTEPVPGVAERASRGAVNVRDVGTEEITLRLAGRLEGLLGAKPYVVIAGFHRRYIDANRAEFLAFESADAGPYYRAYHDSIRAFVDEARRAHAERAILIDIHVHSKTGYRDRVCRGTRNGMTVSRLLEREGPEALTGPSSILGALRASGYDVFPPDDAVESPGYDGGHTVVAYGSHNSDGIDAIQLEIGSDLVRRREGQLAVSDALAEAIAAF